MVKVTIKTYSKISENCTIKTSNKDARYETRTRYNLDQITNFLLLFYFLTLTLFQPTFYRIIILTLRFWASTLQVNVIMAKDELQK